MHVRAGTLHCVLKLFLRPAFLYTPLWSDLCLLQSRNWTKPDEIWSGFQEVYLLRLQLPESTRHCLLFTSTMTARPVQPQLKRGTAL
ncbi:hypothetical protein GBAR_LOCUS48 [Geodia barretti]|uniref:Secreted protein n=1 Tax=Geodia barretti TaxID=519541 RepID=A0AA35VR71_GEOBA|nr:hypothetical protein GBAR_LOCUS48 [Geodia barretti]